MKLLLVRLFCLGEFYTALKHAAAAFFNVDEGFTGAIRSFPAVNTESLPFLAFACVMNFEVCNFMALQKII